MKRTKLLLSGAVMLLPLPALAQAPADTAPAGNNQGVSNAASAQESGSADIIVTAQGRAQRLSDIPISASVTSAETLAKSNIISLQDLSARLPNVKIAQGSVDIIAIRGVGSGQNAGFEQSVGTFVDGVYRGRSRAIRGALFDVERVEVLKGPQSTFFGNNTVAGALNITTRKPGAEFGYNGTALYGFETNEYSLELGADVPVTDTLAFRVAGKAYGQDGWIDNETQGRKEPRARNWIGRISAVWRPSDNLTTEARFDHSEVKTDGDGAILFKCPPDPIYGPANGTCATQIATVGEGSDEKIDGNSNNAQVSFDRYSYTEAALTNRLQIGDFKLISTTGYFENKDSMGASVLPVAFGGVGGTGSAVATNFSEDYHQFSQELRLESSRIGAFEFTLGGYFARAKLEASQVLGFYFAPFGLFAPPLTADTPVAGASVLTVKDRNLSAFGALTAHMSDRLRLNLGARYTSVRKNATRFGVFGTGTTSPTLDTLVPAPLPAQEALAALFSANLTDFPNKTRTDSKFLPSVSLQYDLTSNIMGYASFATGFKAGGYAAALTTNDYDPESVKSYELGLKGTPVPGLFFTLAAFLSDYKDLQETTNLSLPSGVSVALIQNAAKARSKGIEFGTNWRISPALRLNLDVARLNARYSAYPNAPCTVLQTPPSGVCSRDLSGSVRAMAPKWSGSVSANVTLPVSGDYQIGFDPTLAFTTGFYTLGSIDPITYQSGYAKADARISFGPKSGKWDIAVIGKNLTDIRTASFRNTAIGARGSGYAIPDQPRVIYVQFSIRH